VTAADLIVRAKGIRKELGDARTAATTPFEKTKKAIIAWFKAHDEPLATTQLELENKHRKYSQEKAAAAAKEEARLRALAEKRHEKAVAKAEAKGEEPPPMDIPMPSVQAPPKAVQTASGTLRETRRWTWKPETDEAAMVEALAKAGEYGLLCIDRGMVKRRIDSGVRNIPGAVVYEDVSYSGGRA
jgi:hypothetical protein